MGGRESVPRFAGSFATHREALLRRSWVAGQLAAMVVPDLTLLAAPATAETLTQAAKRWQASRVDIAENTRLLHRSAVNAVMPLLGDRPVDEITPADVAELVGALTAKGRKRETVRKSLLVLAMIFDYAGVQPNPARDKVTVRLPRERKTEIVPPTADHVEAVLAVLPTATGCR